MKFAPILLGAAALALNACSTTEAALNEPAEGRDCFRAEQAAGYSVVDDHNIRVRVNPSRSYTLHTTWNANDLDWTTAIALRSDTGWICTGNALGSVDVTGGTLGRTYPIQSITRDPPEPGTEGS